MATRVERFVSNRRAIATVVVLLGLVVCGATVLQAAWVFLGGPAKAIVGLALALMAVGGWSVGAMWASPRVAQPGVNRMEIPRPSLRALAEQVIGGDHWCPAPAAIEQTGIALALLLSRQLHWRAIGIRAELADYLHEWSRRDRVGDPAVTHMFYEIARRATIEMSRASAPDVWEELLADQPELMSLQRSLRGVVEAFRNDVEQPLMLGRGRPDCAALQRAAAARVQELLGETDALHAEIERWQAAARAEARALREQLQAVG